MKPDKGGEAGGWVGERERERERERAPTARLDVFLARKYLRESDVGEGRMAGDGKFSE